LDAGLWHWGNCCPKNNHRGPLTQIQTFNFYNIFVIHFRLVNILAGWGHVLASLFASSWEWSVKGKGMEEGKDGKLPS
jgi:hypothetical protein